MGYNQKNGFTLIELIMVIAIIAVLSTTGAYILGYLVQNSVTIPNQLNMEMIATDAMDIMIDGDSQARGLRFSRSITDAQPNELTFNVLDGQGNVMSVRYRLNASKLYRSVNGGADMLIPYYIPATGVTMAGKSGTLFTYYDAGEGAPASADNVRRVEITLIAQTGSGSYEDWEGRSEQSSSVTVRKFM